jgi:radical SAM protein with 4Fe4S-binding SPASM domain
VIKSSDIADTVKTISDTKSLSEKVQRADQTDRSFTFQYQITETCNLRCTHCYQDESIVYQASTKELLLMLDKGLQTMEKWHFTPRIPLSGGEPLMSPSLWPLLHHLEAYKKDHEVMSAVLTNGTLIDRDIAETLATYTVVRFVQVSLDGATSETHNTIRGKGSFEKALKGIAHLTKAGVPAHIHFVVHKQNYEDAFQMVDLAEEVGAEFVLVTRLVPFGRGKSMNALTPDEVHHLYTVLGERTDKALSQMVDNNPAVFVSRVRCDWPVICTGECLSSMAALINKNGNHCQVGKRYIAVMPDGTCYACRRMPVVVGNLLQHSFEDMWNHPFLWKMRKKYAYMKGKCQKCPFNTDSRLNFTCMGGASCISYGMYGDPFMPDPQCSFDPEKDAAAITKRVDTLYAEYKRLHH